MSFQFGLTKKIRGPVPRIPFEDIAARILGSGYSLSLVACGNAFAQRLNVTYRKKTYSPNVLSFPLSKMEGEIILNIPVATLEAKKYRVSVSERTAFLFIHGCLHLAGYKHGKKMDQLESKHLKRAGF